MNTKTPDQLLRLEQARRLSEQVAELLRLAGEPILTSQQLRVSQLIEGRHVRGRTVAAYTNP